MERKTKHRLIGMLVIIGLVLVLLPFLQDTKPGIPETAAIKAPPFPDQAVQLTSDEMEDAQDTVVGRILTPPAKPMAQEDAPVSGQGDTLDNPSLSAEKNNPTVSEALPSAPAAVLMDDDDSREAVKPKPAAKPEVVRDLAPMIDSQINKAAQSRHYGARTKNAVHVIKHVKPARMKIASASFRTIDSDGLFKLKSAVWVIQMGSFKNKANALRLVNKLRANGYHAFIQQMGSDTRVFVGPENKQASARMLASQLKSELKINGVVISYKPLTL